MNDIFEYYTLRLTTRSPVHIGSGQKIGKKEFCLLTKTDTLRIMDMEKLINYFVYEAPDKQLELFEEFMIEDRNLKKEKRMGKDGREFTGADCLEKKWLHSFLNLIGMPVSARKKCALYEISNDGIFQDDKTSCSINTFIRSYDGKAYIPGSSVKGMLRTALLQMLIRKNIEKLPAEGEITREDKAITRLLINTLRLKYKNNIPDTSDAVNSIMRGIIISDSEPVPNECLTVCKKIDLTSKKGGGELHELNVIRECIKPYTEIVFHIKLDKRYFCPEGIDICFKDLFYEMIRSFDEDYRNYYLSGFSEIDGNLKDLENDFLILGGGSGYFGKNIIYTRYGFNNGMKKVSEYMKSKKVWIDKLKTKVQSNPDDYHLHGISPHILKLTRYQGKLYYMGICDLILERTMTE